MQKRLIIALLAILGILFGSHYTTTEKPNVSPDTLFEEATVTTVIDGDTIIVSTDSGTKTVRLLGIDTPEVDPNRGGPECYGREASDFLKELLEGSRVQLETDSSQGNVDTYDRLLRFVYTSEGLNINQLLLEKGYAMEFTYRTAYRYQKEFRDTETSAQDQKRGLWGACNR